MKKILNFILCAIVLFAMSVYFCSCKTQSDDAAVHLVAINASQVGVMSDIDYYVVAEPAASVKVKSIPELDFAGSLQELYGSENGYPQAVIVAKKDLACNTDYVKNFLTAISANKSWLMSDNTSVSDIVAAVHSHLTADLSPVFSEKNLTKDVISNCGINFVSATESKESILKFMQEMNGVGTSSFGMPDESFFWDGKYTPSAYDGKVSVYAPDGAPALGIANVLADAEYVANTQFEIVAAETIQTYVTGATPKADICVLPVNLAVKLIGSGEKYKLVGTLTHGNLYMVSTNGNTITKKNISELKGKTVGVINLAAVPGLTFKVILKNSGIKYEEEYRD